MLLGNQTSPDPTGKRYTIPSKSNRSLVPDTDWFNLLKSPGHVMHQQFNINNCTFCPHCIYVFCIYLRTNSDLCHLQHKLIGFITELKSVYCAVRTGSLNKAVCSSYLYTDSNRTDIQGGLNFSVCALIENFPSTDGHRKYKFTKRQGQAQ